MEILENETLALILDTILYIFSSFLLFAVGKAVFGWMNRNINTKEELVKRDNLAFAIANIGYYIGLLLVIGGVILGTSYGIVADLMDILVYGILAILLLNLTSVVNDKLILYKFSTTKEIITDQNVGTGVVLAASFIASGLIVFGAISGEGIDFFPGMRMGYLLSGVLTTLAFWTIGNILLFVIAWAYNQMLPYNIHDYIEKDNVPVGIGFAGAIVAIAILISHGTAGDFESWFSHLEKIGEEALIGLALLPVVRWVTDKVLLPGEKITDELINQEHPNVGAGLIEAFAYIGGAVLLTWCL